MSGDSHVDLYNADKMTCILRELAEQDVELTPDILTGLPPYRTAHINRFGDYLLDVERSYGPLNFAKNIEARINERQQ